MRYELQGESNHTILKRLYQQTNKRNVTAQFATHERRRRALQAPRRTKILRKLEESLPKNSPETHYHISIKHSSHLVVTTIFQDYKNFTFAKVSRVE